MKVKRFFAPDMKTAMRRVREEIGPDAVILSNKRVAGGVEVVASPEAEYEAAQAEVRRKQESRKAEQIALLTRSKDAPAGERAPTPPNRPKELSREELDAELRRARERIAEAALKLDQPQVSRSSNRQIDDDSDDLISFFAGQQTPPLPSAPAPQEDPRIDTLQSEIAELKQMLASQLKAQQIAPEWSAMTSPQPVAPVAPVASRPAPVQRLEGVPGRIQQRLERLGLSAGLTQSYVSGLEHELSVEKAWRNALVRFAESLPLSGEELIERGGMIAFVGPTGSGKTTTIGKLAARYVLEHGSAGLALVTTDSYRIAAHEQLKTFGRILDVPVRVVDENNPLEDVLASLRSKRIVLIDTAGMNRRDPSGQEQLDMLSQAGVRMKKLLVLSTSSQRQLLEQAYSMYAPLGLYGCVLTKMDESGSLGEALSLAIEKQIRIAYVTDGQRVPDDIELARRKDLVSRTVVLAQQQGSFDREESTESQELARAPSTKTSARGRLRAVKRTG